MPKKLTYEQVKLFIEEQGYQLLSTEYKNVQTKLKLQCFEGHIFKTSFNSFQQGRRCPECAKKIYGQYHKLTYNQVKEYIESYDYKLLSTKYKNSVTKLKLQCPKNHIYKVHFMNFKAGRRCPECANKKKYDYDFIKLYIESYNYKLLSENYKNNRTKLSLQCPEGHICEISYINFKHGTRCSECAKNIYGQYHKLTYEYVKSYIESYNYSLLSNNYKNAHSKLILKCPYNHVYKTSYNNFKEGSRCPICYYESTSSKPERELKDFVSTIYDGKILSNNRDTIINPLTGHNLELDVYLPEINKAIEFNGTYWHSFNDVVIKDKIKSEQCRNNNITLLTIHEENWMVNKEMCLQVIENFIN